MSRPEDSSYYLDRALPPVPPRKSSLRISRAKTTGSSINPRGRSSTFGHSREGSSVQDGPTINHRFSFESRASRKFEVGEIPEVPVYHRIVETPPLLPSQKLTAMAQLERTGVLQIPFSRHLAWSDSGSSSIRSLSIYSGHPDQDHEVDPIDAIVDQYDRLSWVPSWVSSDSPSSPTDPFYLHAAQSRSDSQLGKSSFMADKHYSQILPSFPPESRMGHNSERSTILGDNDCTPIALEDLVQGLRHNSDAGTEIWSAQSQWFTGFGEDYVAPLDYFSGRLSMMESMDERKEATSIGDRNVRILSPNTNTLHFSKPLPNQARRGSHFSDYSTSSVHSVDSCSNPLSQTRSQSLLRSPSPLHTTPLLQDTSIFRDNSPFRNDSPFRIPPRPAPAFREKAPTPSIRIPSPQGRKVLPPAAPLPRRRKSIFASGKHPLKSPFPFTLNRRPSAYEPNHRPGIVRRMSEALGLSTPQSNPSPASTASSGQNASPQSTAPSTVSQPNSASSPRDTKFHTKITTQLPPQIPAQFPSPLQPFSPSQLPVLLPSRVPPPLPMHPYYRTVLPRPDTGLTRRASVPVQRARRAGATPLTSTSTGTTPIRRLAKPRQGSLAATLGVGLNLGLDSELDVRTRSAPAKKGSISTRMTGALGTLRGRVTGAVKRHKSGDEGVPPPVQVQPQPRAKLMKSILVVGDGEKSPGAAGPRWI